MQYVEGLNGETVGRNRVSALAEKLDEYCRIEPISFPCRLQDSYGTVIASFSQWRIMRMPLKKPGYRMALMLGTTLLLVWSIWSATLAAEGASIIAQSADYFPDSTIPIQATMALRIVSTAAIASASSITARNQARPLKNNSYPIRSCASR